MKPVSRTAYYCCGCRMHDAESDNPVIGDYYARSLMGEQGLIYWEDFKDFTFPRASNTARHFIVETMLRKLLHEDPTATIIQIGAGLDTRAFRINGGLWVEVDAPEVIHYKENIIPASTCLNDLHRIPISFANEKLVDKLMPFSERKNVIIVVEGVWFYLTELERRELLKTLTKLFSKHILICDLMTRNFFDKLAAKGVHKKLVEHGTTFVDMSDKPHDTILQYGYEMYEKRSLIKTARSLGLNGWWKGVLMRIMPVNLVMGYMVYWFHFNNQDLS